jgi:hypothetical protein
MVQYRDLQSLIELVAETFLEQPGDPAEEFKLARIYPCRVDGRP